MRRRSTLNRLCCGLSLLLSLPAGSAVCSVSAAGLAFGSYAPLSEQPLDSAAAITVTCDVAVAYALALSSGGGSFMDRRMSGPGHELRYNLYVDVPRVTVWGDGSSATAVVSGSVTPGNHTVSGRVLPRQNVAAGTYVDNIIVTLTY